MTKSNHDNMEKGPESIIPRRQHRPTSLLPYVKLSLHVIMLKEVVNVVVLAIIFTRYAVERLNPHYFLDMA
jgi:hypothetical protein